MPDMYHETSYEAYGDYKPFAEGMEAKTPVEGTVPRNWMPYPYEDSNEGYKKSKDLKNPVAYTKENLMKGREMYSIYCSICHGEKGAGKGSLVENEKILGVPAYNNEGRDITMGSSYHVMYYGRNTMGAYSAQTSIEERWQIAHHVLDLKRELNGKSKREFVKPPKDSKKGMMGQSKKNNPGSVGGETKSKNKEKAKKKEKKKANDNSNKNN
jgi:mono/diheme cytochrome c family protein